MTSRELPPKEWSRLKGTPLARVAGVLRPDCCRVLVVEDEDGRIVGQWALILALHGEGVWIDPAHQKRGAVARKLWLLAKRLMQPMAATHVFTAAETPEVAQLIERHHGVRLPGTHYMLPVGD